MTELKDGKLTKKVTYYESMQPYFMGKQSNLKSCTHSLI